LDEEQLAELVEAGVVHTAAQGAPAGPPAPGAAQAAST
jgi:hypothetical protein